MFISEIQQNLLRTRQFSERWIEIPQFKIQEFDRHQSVEAFANPEFYKAVRDEIIHLSGQIYQVRVFNFGAGALRIERDVLGHDSFKSIQKIKKKFTALDSNPILLKEGLRFLTQDFGKEIPVDCVIHHAGEFNIPTESNSTDLAISRMLLLNLNPDQLNHHLNEVKRILKVGTKYIAVVLNPDYMRARILLARPSGFKVQSSMAVQLPLGSDDEGRTAQFVYYDADSYLKSFSASGFTSIHLQEIGKAPDVEIPLFLMITAIK